MSALHPASTLPAGTRKVISIDHDAAERNTKRRPGRLEAVVRIVIEDTQGPIQIIRAISAKCLGEVRVEYQQHGFATGRLHAAVVTDGAIEINGPAE
ncbi:hypothetical protein [Pseudoxanthomonas sp.]|jgi:hypothetical protein|uniref:hypothetical protein n=1 Tax=Pseudoxanthomonas sp. TaxID=1871049 RepID=UPI002E0ECBD6|nr:hypothetical protein [Pseudoxanthomonas sp.]